MNIIIAFIVVSTALVSVYFGYLFGIRHGKYKERARSHKARQFIQNLNQLDSGQILDHVKPLLDDDLKFEIPTVFEFLERQRKKEHE